MKFTVNVLAFLLFFLVFSLPAQIPTGYYSNAEGETEADLKSDLYRIISSGYVSVGYDGLYNVYATSDITSDGKVWDMYSTISWTPGEKKCGNYKVVGDCYNREHSIPQSWFSSRSPMVSDAFHVYPTDGKVNGQRSSYPFGECSGGTTLSGGKGRLGSSSFSGYGGTVFEPDDEYKGDFARTYFYFATRYEDIMTSIGGESFNGSVYPAFTSWSQDLFLKWHRQDPVSQKEIVRNNEVAKFQKNRNPYIDYPELAEYVWGNRKGLPWSATNSSIGLLSPSNGSTLSFGTVAYQHTESISVLVKGNELTDEISLAISGEHASFFSLANTSISKEDAMAGVQLIINYNANTVGSHTALLTISGADFTDVKVTLSAITTDDFMALPATEINSTGFTANWTASATATAYLLNVFSLSDNGNTQSQVVLSEDFNNGLPASWSSDGFSNAETDGTIKMASGSQACKLTTPTLNLTGENNMLYARAKQYGTDTGAALTITVDNQELIVWTTTSGFQTFSISLPSATAMSKIAFSASSGKRIYLDSVNVSSQASSQVAESVNGYPVTIGNVLTYQVDGLKAQSNYYYTVTPIGGSTGESEQIRVLTYTTGLNNFDFIHPTFNVGSSGIVARNISANSHVIVYNMLGRKLAEINPTTSDLMIEVQSKGAYIIKVECNNIINSYKVIY